MKLSRYQVGTTNFASKLSGEACRLWRAALLSSPANCMFLQWKYLPACGRAQKQGTSKCFTSQVAAYCQKPCMTSSIEITASIASSPWYCLPSQHAQDAGMPGLISMLACNVRCATTRKGAFAFMLLPSLVIPTQPIMPIFLATQPCMDLMLRYKTSQPQIAVQIVS